MREFDKFKIEVVELIAPARFEVLLNCCAQNLFKKPTVCFLNSVNF